MTKYDDENNDNDDRADDYDAGVAVWATNKKVMIKRMPMMALLAWKYNVQTKYCLSMAFDTGKYLANLGKYYPQALHTSP